MDEFTKLAMQFLIELAAQNQQNSKTPTAIGLLSWVINENNKTLAAMKQQEQVNTEQLMREAQEKENEKQRLILANVPQIPPASNNQISVPVGMFNVPR